MDAAQEFATKIAATFNTKPRRHGREWRTFCAHHEADAGCHTPSFAVWNKGAGRYSWKCMTGCSAATVKAALKDRGVSVEKSGPMSTEQMLAAAKANEQRRVASLTKAKESLMGAKAVQPEDPVWAYLTGRGLGDAFVDNYRKQTLFTADDPLHPGFPALLGTILDLRTLREERMRVTGIMTLSLMKDGTPRLDENGKKLRSIVGTQKGFGVPFGIPGPHLVVAEGVETMLAAMQLLNISFGVATLSASNTASLIVPEWVERVTIAADNDDPGMSTAATLAGLLVGIVPAQIRFWGSMEQSGTGWDANDELLARRV